ncbi:MAG: hypothetical protein MSG64_08045 [Pyrinomonadaceae bacterium MAG19_C2-C3]|nr:hypothetical protein [Pyrinomonadaceae bacterium MAG19_C2-C3]
MNDNDAEIKDTMVEAKPYRKGSDEREVEIEQESAEAMNSDVPQPPDASETTEVKQSRK